LILDPERTELERVDRAMLVYAVLLTQEPHEAATRGVDGLRDVGFSDAAILDLCQVTAYFNYVNRLAEGLNVSLEPYWSERAMITTEREFRDRRRWRTWPTDD
jgi:uncharacterized peroxidase-related enzyme